MVNGRAASRARRQMRILSNRAGGYSPLDQDQSRIFRARGYAKVANGALLSAAAAFGIDHEL